ncbi:MAG: hypothetical protein WAM79_21420 [Candidatus Sulfotelmatobacter sp.]
MRKPKLRYSSSVFPELSALNKLPLAWDWRSGKINKNTLNEFAEYIYWFVGCDDDQIKEWAVDLLLELVEKARSEPE